MAGMASPPKRVNVGESQNLIGRGVATMTTAKEKLVQTITMEKLPYIGDENRRKWMNNVIDTVTRNRWGWDLNEYELKAHKEQVTSSLLALDISEIVAIGLDYGIYPEGDPVEMLIREKSFKYLVEHGTDAGDTLEKVNTLTQLELDQGASFFGI